jgi:hypothetical protein
MPVCCLNPTKNRSSHGGLFTRVIVPADQPGAMSKPVGMAEVLWLFHHVGHHDCCAAFSKRISILIRLFTATSWIFPG